MEEYKQKIIQHLGIVAGICNEIELIKTMLNLKFSRLRYAIFAWHVVILAKFFCKIKAVTIVTAISKKTARRKLTNEGAVLATKFRT